MTEHERVAVAVASKQGTVTIEMYQERLLKVLFVLIWVLTFMHMIAEYYHLYWYLSWFDIVTHFLGGVWVGMLVIWLYCYSGYVRKPSLPDKNTFWILLGTGLGIGLLWEGYELIMWLLGDGIPFQYMSDTLLDIVVDVSGMFFGYRLTRKISSGEEYVLKSVFSTIFVLVAYLYGGGMVLKHCVSAFDIMSPMDTIVVETILVVGMLLVGYMARNK